MTPMDEDRALYFVIYPEDGVWVAHGLQVNLVTHGESLAEIRENIHLVARAYERTATSGMTRPIPQADAAQWTRFVRAREANRNLDDFLNAPVSEGTYTMEVEYA